MTAARRRVRKQKPAPQVDLAGSLDELLAFAAGHGLHLFRGFKETKEDFMNRLRRNILKAREVEALRARSPLSGRTYVFPRAGDAGWVRPPKDAK